MFRGAFLSDKTTAIAIHEAFLKKSGDALFSGDFDAFLSCFFLPQQIVTFEGSRWLLEPSDVRDVFDNMRQRFDDLGITDMARRCVVAEFSGPTTIDATHETRMLVKDQIVSGPYPSFSILQEINGNWQVSHSQYAIGDENGHSAALLGAGSKEPFEIKEPVLMKEA